MHMRGVWAYPPIHGHLPTHPLAPLYIVGQPPPIARPPHVTRLSHGMTRMSDNIVTLAHGVPTGPGGGGVGRVWCNPLILLEFCGSLLSFFHAELSWHG